MAELQIQGFNISKEQLKQLANDATQVSIKISYDTTLPAGFKMIAEGPLGSVSLCPKPCPKVIIVAESNNH